ncbi:MAG TPA: hypothetical protein VNP94_00060 [Actinomycetota bacterium]|nr:hypothetical protein [Actinomycetota bacterium]
MTCTAEPETSARIATLHTLVGDDVEVFTLEVFEPALDTPSGWSEILRSMLRCTIPSLVLRPDAPDPLALDPEEVKAPVRDYPHSLTVARIHLYEDWSCTGELGDDVGPPPAIERPGDAGRELDRIQFLIGARILEELRRLATQISESDSE